MKDSWTCTLCAKVNTRLDTKCQVCGRPKGYISKHLPFHPSYKPVEGARKALKCKDVIALLEAGADPDQIDSEGWTGTHWATAMGRLDLLDLYLEYGASINFQKSDGKTPLHLACELGDAETVLYLIQRGAEIELRADIDGLTPLHTAAKEGNKECVEALALAGADLNIQTTCGKLTALHYACLAGFVDIVFSLINVSNDPIRMCQKFPPLLLDIEDADGWTPYSLAEFRGHKRILDILDTMGARKKRTGI